MRYALRFGTPRQCNTQVRYALRFEDLCLGNRYTTTIHVINSAIVKLSKLTVATKVFRGISGIGLPQSFLKGNEFGVRGGIEGAFMSTTLDRNVAMQYASSKGVGIVFEIRQVRSNSLRMVVSCSTPPLGEWASCLR